MKGESVFGEAAIAAVKQWRYEPSDGSRVLATIAFNFVPPPEPPRAK